VCRNPSNHELVVPRKLKCVHRVLLEHDWNGFELWTIVRLVVLLVLRVRWSVLYIRTNYGFS